MFLDQHEDDWSEHYVLSWQHENEESNPLWNAMKRERLATKPQITYEQFESELWNEVDHGSYVHCGIRSLGIHVNDVRYVKLSPFLLTR